METSAAQRAHDARLTERDRGAVMIEFAIILPVLMMVVLGLLTGGISLGRSMSLSSAAREAARFGATYPTTAGLDSYLDLVAAQAVTESNGDLASTVSSRYLCVAYVSPGTDDLIDQTKRRVQNGSTAATYDYDQACYSDGRPNEERRVQVVLSRTTEFDVFVTQRTITLTTRSTARYEVSTAV